MSRGKNKKEGEYEEIAKTTRNIEPYRPVTLEEVCDCLKHEDSIQIILSALRNRKDADQIFIPKMIQESGISQEGPPNF